MEIVDGFPAILVAVTDGTRFQISHTSNSKIIALYQGEFNDNEEVHTI